MSQTIVSTEAGDPIDCEFRTLRDVDEMPLCQVVAELTELALELCETSDSACRYCLKCGTAPQAPNKATASMSVHAARRAGADGAGIVDRFKHVLTAPTITVSNTPCVLRGVVTRQQPCKPCQAGSLTPVLVPVFRCSVFGECTLSNTGTLPKIHACATCGSRQAEFAQIDARPLPPAVAEAARHIRNPLPLPLIDRTD